MKLLKHLLGGAIMLALPLFLTSCDDILGTWDKPTPVTPAPTPTPTKVDVTSIELNKTTLPVTFGAAAEQLTATVNPDDATDKTVTWKSSDEAVATVSETGLVTFVALVLPPLPLPPPMAPPKPPTTKRPPVLSPSPQLHAGPTST